MIVPVVVVLFTLALYFATQRSTGSECEVCIEFRGKSACRRVRAPDRDRALAEAAATACAVLASGVTDSMACNRVLPTSQRCEECS